MQNNNLEYVRSLLIEAMETLLHPEENSKLTVESAKGIKGLADTIVSSAKVECDFLRLSGQEHSKFLGNTTKVVDITPSGKRISDNSKSQQ